MAFSDRFLDKKYQLWARAVKERDNFTCQICFKQDVYLHSHHINSWDFFIKERYVINNGITWCSKHHIMFHDIFGRGKNTIVQYKQFLETLEILKKIAESKI